MDDRDSFCVRVDSKGQKDKGMDVKFEYNFDDMY